MASTPVADQVGPVKVNGNKSEKNHKRDKSHSRKRSRLDDADGKAEDEPRERKKSKKHGEAQLNGDEELPNGQHGSEEDSKKSHKKHKKANGLTNGDAHPAVTEPSVDAPAEDGEVAKKSKDKKKHRKHERSEKSPEPKTQPQPSPVAETEPKKKRRKDKHKAASVEVAADPVRLSSEEAERVDKESTNRERSKDKKSKKERKKHHKDAKSAAEEQDSTSEGEAGKGKRTSKELSKKSRKLSPDVSEPDGMDIDTPEATTALDASTLPKDPIFPFYTQTVSLYVPFYPVGFDKPITNVTSQHLEPLLNHYSPLFRGVLLGYHNVNLSERPVRADPNNPPTDRTGAVLTSVDEYAVGFGWLTADLDLFVPRRGAWMEGTVNLQSEGHIGVVCWDKFNASIEAKRLPQGWRWVDLANNNNGHAKAKKKSEDGLLSPKSDGEAGDEEDMLDGEELEVAQMHTTGYWVDGGGKRAGGTLRFRIKNFDVGLAGDYGYLSIEGTMLGEDGERELGAVERAAEKGRRRKQNVSGLLRPMSRRVPEFSMTRFGREDQEEDSGQRTELYKGSRPGTPDD